MSQAEIALWTRARTLTRADIRSALYERREIVKTSALRRTLHLISAQDFATYVTALKPGSAIDSNAAAFDAFLLAHATKTHLVDRSNYKRVWRAQGWVSPVVLLGGTIAGVWFAKRNGNRCTLDVDLFDRQPRAIRDGIAREADALGGFLGTNCTAHIR